MKKKFICIYKKSNFDVSKKNKKRLDFEVKFTYF